MFSASEMTYDSALQISFSQIQIELSQAGSYKSLHKALVLCGVTRQIFWESVDSTEINLYFSAFAFIVGTLSQLSLIGLDVLCPVWFRSYNKKVGSPWTLVMGGAFELG